MKSDKISIRNSTTKCFPEQNDKADNFEAVYKGAQKFIEDVFKAMGVDLEKYKKLYKGKRYSYKMNKIAQDVMVSSCINSAGFPSLSEICSDIGENNAKAQSYMQLINEFIKENFSVEEIEEIKADFRKRKSEMEGFIDSYKQLGINLMFIDRDYFLDFEKLFYDLEHLDEYEEQFVEYGKLSKKSSTIISALILIKQSKNYKKYISSTINAAEAIHKLQKLSNN